MAALEKPESRTGTHKVKQRWKVMIFMGASVDVPDMQDLTDQAYTTLQEIRNAHLQRDHSSHVEVDTFVQLHGRGDPKRFHIEDIENPEEIVPANEQNTANGSALTHFIEWAGQKDMRKADEIEYRMLVLWGHAYEFTIAPVVTAAGIDGIDFAEVTKTFRELQSRWRRDHPGDDGKLDIVGFDSCDLATIEMSHELSPFAHYSLASQISVPIPGWPYGEILRRLKSASVPMKPRDLGAVVVRQYCATYEQQRRAVSLTFINLDRADDVFKATQALATSLVQASVDPDEIALAIGLFFRSQTWEDKPFVDVADLCLNLWRYSQNGEVINAAAHLGDLLIRPGRDPEQSKDQPFVLEHGRNAHPTARLTGVSLYAPHVVPEFDWEGASSLYAKFVFARETLWGKYVETLAAEALQ